MNDYYDIDDYYDMNKMRYITRQEETAYRKLCEDENPSVKECQKAIKHLLNQVDVMGDAPYDPYFGDNRLCTCGHPYYRHFDTYEDMAPVGCKYCPLDRCSGFQDSGTIATYDEKGFRIIKDLEG